MRSVLTIPEVADYLGVSTETVHEWIEDGVLGTYAWGIPMVEVYRMIRTRRVKGNA